MYKYPIPSPIIDTQEQIQQSSYSDFKSPQFATIDISLTIDYLKQYDGNKATFEAYRREIERLLQWSWLIAKKSILEIKRQDIQDYIEFCLSPPKLWIGTKRAVRFIERNGKRIANSKWRPFVATVSKQNFSKGEKPDKNHYQ